MRSLRRYGVPLAALLLFFLPAATSNNYYVHVATTVCIYVILVAGLDLVVGYAGNVSVGHAGLLAVGAYTAAILTTRLDVPFPLAAAAGVLLTAGFGLLLGVPALRLSGPYLAMATIAFGFIINSVIKESVPLTNGTQGISIPHQLSFGGLSFEGNNFFYVAYSLMLLSLLGVRRVTTSYWGRAFEALKESQVAAGSCGISRYRFRLAAFVLSATLAGLAGALFIHVNRYIGPESFDLTKSILFLTALIIGGTRSILGNIIGALAAVALLDIFNNLSQYQLMIYGGLLLFTLYFMPEGVAGLLRRILSRLLPPRSTETPTTGGAAGDEAEVKEVDGAVLIDGKWSDAASASASGTRPRAGERDVLLKTEGLTISFGGLVAVNDLNLTVRSGEVRALIGPNGSGKSTTVNLLSGVYRPTAGKIRFAGQVFHRLPPHKIARAGIGRTFQNPALFRDMTALENVLVGLHPSFGGGLLHILMMTRKARLEEQGARVRAQALLDFVGLGAEAATRAHSLPYGRQRLLEIARALALDPSLLLLDEPAAGLTGGEIADIIALIGRLRERGLSILLIEHHMDLVMKVSDEVTVLDFGNTIAEGRPEAIQQDEQVIAAYLGTSVDNAPGGGGRGEGEAAPFDA